ncbi:nucleoporin, Nup133/Nup155-like protein [Artemisia annua]|uniref:Nucleoporin, Nup133/Nup155-like protein n=1 Tax=Artemisia annua TaxID=35608 RepID=A0A2U1QI45_ARTAN|nr:nucleoporin, Nup133/Nup155-like protein [Artemisia annua]
MFSPGTKKKSNYTSRKQQPPSPPVSYGSPVTPAAENRKAVTENVVPDRPSTGTPAPWASSRLSVLARIPATKKSDKGDDVDPIQPVFVGEVPQVVRDEQTNILQKRLSGDTGIYGGMDKATSLAWIICGNRLFIWSYLSPSASRKCTVLELPSSILEDGDVNKNSGSAWLLCVLDWDHTTVGTNTVFQQRTSAGVLLCNRKTQAFVYWPNIYSSSPAVTYMDQPEYMTALNKQQQKSSYNSLIASAIPDKQNVCIAIACSSNGQLYRFICSPSGIQCRENVSVSSHGSQISGQKGYPRSLIWHAPNHSAKESKRRFLLLTDHEILCLSVDLFPDFSMSKLWSHEIVGNDGDVGIQKGLAGQKKIWPLDMQIDNNGKVITVLVATFCKDRATSSSYTEYSLLTMQYKSGLDVTSESTFRLHDKILEKRSPIEVIIPKARVEEEDFLFSMRLKVGGKPSGSSVVLSGDGTATVTRYWRNTSRLYKFDLPYDAGKVLDASVFPSDDGEDGAWAVLTEKAGVWAIPEKAVLLGGVEPPERSLSRKGSSNEGSTQEERRNVSFTGNIAPRRASSEAWDAGDKHRPVFTGIVPRSAQDEESEALLSQFFHEFLQSGVVTGTLDKLKKSGAFERDGETNVFARVSKSIVDTLAKHWTTTRGAEIVALSVVSTQLLDKQQKHQKFLQFLALSKCHEELSSRQRKSLQIIMEHGEKLAAMIQLRELQNAIRQQSSNGAFTNANTQNELSGSIWDLIQLVGEKARQNTVLLMDRDNAEVFYSKVSELEEVFHCLEKKLSLVVSEDMPFTFQLQRTCELSSMCVTLLNTSMTYKDENQMWYPSPEGLTPWYCQTVVRSGMWTLASFMLHLLKDMGPLDRSAKLEFYSHLEVLVKVLLEAYSGSVTAKVEREEEHGALLEEYWHRRDILLDTLYQQVKGFNETTYQGSSEVMEEHDKEITQKLSSNLLAIAKRHEGYQTLWNLCFDHNDLELLRSLMHDSMGPKGGFSNFVFKQMHNSKQFSKLMRLGEEFPEDLAIFLKEHPDLLWLHEIFLHQFSPASETLHVMALSDGDNSISEVEEPASYDTRIEPTLADRRRLLNLSKIAAVAGKNADYDTKLKRIEADLKILKLQQEISELLPDDEETQDIAHKLLPPADLIQLCLRIQNKQVALYAFDIFAWTSLSFLRCNTSLLEECWKNATNQDDWETINQTSVSKGLSDEENLEVLKETALFQASRRCYGSESETYEGGFEEVLPLRQEKFRGFFCGRNLDAA